MNLNPLGENVKFELAFNSSIFLFDCDVDYEAFVHELEYHRTRGH